MKKLSFSLITVSVVALSLFGASQVVDTASKNDVRGNSIDELASKNDVRGNSIELNQFAKNEVR